MTHAEKNISTKTQKAAQNPRLQKKDEDFGWPQSSKEKKG